MWQGTEMFLTKELVPLGIDRNPIGKPSIPLGIDQNQ